jgi:hypothetical protein
MRNITYLEVRILKTAGKNIDVKVTVKVTPEKDIVVYMRDSVFYNYKTAAHYLRHITETELSPVYELGLVVRP